MQIFTRTVPLHFARKHRLDDFPFENTFASELCQIETADRAINPSTGKNSLQL